jgi:hypothetical protein
MVGMIVMSVGVRTAARIPPAARMFLRGRLNLVRVPGVLVVGVGLVGPATIARVDGGFALALTARTARALRWSLAQKLFPAVFTAKVVTLPVALSPQSRRFVHLHPADSVDLHTCFGIGPAASFQFFTIANASRTILLQLMLKIAEYRKG